MAADRYVALGLARPRAPWFTDVARWASSAALPLEFVKCLSLDEARARLASGRPFSAFLVDGALPGLDRDLVEVARAAGCAVVVVEDGRVARDWAAIGASATLPPTPTRDDLALVLDQAARPIDDLRAQFTGHRGPTPSAWRGSLVAVMGAGGAGASTVAMAIAQGSAADPLNQGAVLLADLALDADLALLHDLGEVLPGLPELIDAHRLGRPSPDELATVTFDVVDRGYRLLLGLRRHRDWATLRRRSLDAALDTLVRSARVVVADTDHDLEGEVDCGSNEVEDRNLLARRAAQRADLVVVVGRPDPVGLHRLLGIIDDLLGLGVPGVRILPVVNRAPRSPRARAELSATVAALAPPDARDEGLPNPLFLPERHHLDRLHQDARPLPEALVRPATRAVAARLAALDRREPVAEEAVAVVPGSLGHWSAQAELG